MLGVCPGASCPACGFKYISNPKRGINLQASSGDLLLEKDFLKIGQMPGRSTTEGGDSPCSFVSLG